MQSSRMLTARSLLYVGGGGLPDRDPSGHVTCDACWNRDPPANRMTNGCKNMILPQTSLQAVIKKII